MRDTKKWNKALKVPGLGRPVRYFIFIVCEGTARHPVLNRFLLSALRWHPAGGLHQVIFKLCHSSVCSWPLSIVFLSKDGAWDWIQRRTQSGRLICCTLTYIIADDSVSIVHSTFTFIRSMSHGAAWNKLIGLPQECLLTFMNMQTANKHEQRHVNES